MESEYVFQNTEKHIVKRSGFILTHVFYVIATVAQGQTIDKGVIIDCARMPPQGHAGMSNDTWWFNLYVMLSRATKMEHMLLIRPPSRELLERGPPAAVSSALEIFEMREQQSMAEAKVCAERFGILLPPE